ncbi:MAG: hypothetical protein JWQ29_3201, partial [Phenylobacterium sp.]|nr:hypothetical protein [Phenylobacterium sp.]
ALPISMLGLFASPAFGAPVFGGSTQVGDGGAPTIATGATTSVTLHATRTIISWNSFDVGADEAVNFEFGARNWIVFNRVNSFDPAKIDGVITGRVGGAFGGNVWISSPGGIIFGPGSRFDAGGILASAANIDATSFLDPSKSLFDFSGATVLPKATVFLDKGAALTAHGGLLALISQSVATEADTTVKATDGGDVLYGAARSFSIRIAQNVPGDLDLIDFIVPGSGQGSESEVAIDLQGQTSANSVFIAVVSHASTAAAVINLEGLVTAQAATSDGGDIILSGGGGIANRAPGPTLSGAVDTDLHLGAMSASRDIRIQNAGMVFATPWLRPSKRPPVVPPDECQNRDGDQCYDGFNNGDCISSNCAAPLTGDDLFKMSLIDESFEALLANAGNPAFVSTLSAGRDIRLAATADIELGRATGGRNVAVEGKSMQVNGLNASGTLTLKSTGGDIGVAGAAFAGDGSIVGAGKVQVDGLTLTGGASQKATVQATGDVGIGDGVSSFSGAGSIDVTAGGNATINAGNAKLGAVTAQGDVNLRGGALDIASIAGRRILARAASLTIGSATSATDVYIFSQGGGAAVGTATAADDIYVGATGGTASLKTAVITGAGFDNVSQDFPGNPDTFGNGRVVSVTSTADARLGLGTGSVSGATVVVVDATQDAFVDLPGALPGSLSVRAGRDASLKGPTANFSLITAGRDLSLLLTGGDFTNTGALTATRNIAVGATGALRLGDVRADAGSITLTGSSVTAGALSAAEDLTLRATGGGVQLTSYRAGRDLVLEGASLNLGAALAPVGRDLSITTPGDFTSASDISVVRNLTLAINGAANVRALAAGNTVRIVAGDVTLGGAVTAPTIQIESRTGAMRVGGSTADAAPSGGLWLDNAEFGRLRASTAVNLYAGPVAGTARGDLTVLTLDITPASTPSVNLFAGAGRTVLVQGRAAPTTATGGTLRIGDNVNAAWKPTSILISGGIGAATASGGNYTDVRAFDDIKLVASQDILMGSARFIGLIQATAVGDIDVGAQKPNGVNPLADEQSRVFISTAKLEVSANGKVVQQNTSPTPGQAVGLFLTGKASPALLIDPPQVVELFGGYLDASGKFITSFSASGALDFKIVDAAGAPVAKPDGAVYRFNTCDVGTQSCSGSSILAGAGGGDAGGGMAANSLAGAAVPATTEGGFTSDDATGEDPGKS